MLTQMATSFTARPGGTACGFPQIHFCLGTMFRRFKQDWEFASTGTHRFVIISIILVSVLLLALIWTLLRNRDGAEPVFQETAQVEESPEATLETLVPDPSVVPKPRSMDRAVLERHFAAIGGVKRLTSINSLLVSGEVILPTGETLSMVMAKKLGQRIKVSITKPEGTMVMVVTPEDSWRSYRRNGLTIGVEDISPEESENMMRSAYVVSELFLAMSNSWSIEYLGQQAFNYEMAHCYEVKLNQRHFIRFYIDPESFLDIGREERLFDEDGTLTVTRVVTSEHMDIGGLQVPRKSESYKNNELQQTFVVNDVEVNPGILDGTFIRPQVEVAAGD